MTTLDGLRDDIQQAVKSLIELGIIVHDYPDEQSSKMALDLDIQRYVKDLQKIAASAQTVDINVPVDILDYIDAGRNPDIYSREFVELVAKQNQFVHGKLEATKRFNNVLAKELAEAFPEISESLANATVN